MVDLDRYPVHDPVAGARLAQELAQQLSGQSVAVLPEFVRARALDRMAADCNELPPLAHRSESVASPYLAAPALPCPQGPPPSRARRLPAQTVR